MSNYQVARVVDTRLEATSENNVKYVVEEGPAVTAYTPLAAGSHSDLNTNWNLNNIATYTNRDSRICVRCGVTLTLKVTNTTGSALNAINSDNFGFKCWPYNRVINSLQHQINQASYTIQTAQMIDAISRLNNFPQNVDFFENMQPDMVDSYAAATGSSFNPLAPYSSTIAGDGIYKPRTLNYSVTGNSVAAGQTANVVITADLYEPLVSPFNNISDKNRRGLYAITGEIITAQYVSDLTRMFAYVVPAGMTLVSSTATLSNANIATPYLDLIYLTPYESFTREIPNSSVYQFNDYQMFTNNIGGVAANTPLNNITSQVCNFTNIPQKILVYARLSDSSINMTTPDKYLKIKRVSATFDNGLPQLNNATPRQLYDISKRNGLSGMTPSAFQQFQLNAPVTNATPSVPKLFGAGSVLCLDPALDLGLRAGSSSGSTGRYIFQITVDFENATSTDFANCTLFVISVNAAVLERTGSEYRNYLLNLPLDVLNESRALSSIDHQAYMDSKHSNAFLGAGIGDWMRKIGNFAKHAVNWGIRNKDNLGKAYNLARQTVDVGHNLLSDRQSEKPSTRSSTKKKSSKKVKGGADLIYTADIRPRKDMELFYE